MNKWVYNILFGFYKEETKGRRATKQQEIQMSRSGGYCSTHYMKLDFYIMQCHQDSKSKDTKIVQIALKIALVESSLQHSKFI